jgi:hypothetical protein
MATESANKSWTSCEAIMLARDRNTFNQKVEGQPETND